MHDEVSMDRIVSKLGFDGGGRDTQCEMENTMINGGLQDARYRFADDCSLYIYVLM